MRMTLVNNLARATILPERGGLLSSLVLPFGPRSREVLYMPADFSSEESGWPGGGAPLMFPFAGRTFQAERPFFYDLDGSIYNMPLHGFSWAKPWAIKESSERALLITQEDGPGTRELYPFSWRQEAKYTLHSDHIEINYEVTNLGALSDASDTMPVACGIHPYLNINPAPDKTGLLCDATEAFQVTASGAAGKRSPHQPTQKVPLLSEPIYKNLILTGMTRKEAGLRNLESGDEIKVSWDKDSPLKYVVLWRKNEEPFHCIEPWMGLPDAVSNGAGLHRLKKGESLKLVFRIGSSLFVG